MKPLVSLMSALTTVWTIFIIVIIVLMVISLLPGLVIRIDPPAPDEWTVTITNESASMSSNMSVHNGGLFPLRDFQFSTLLYSNNTTLASFSSNKTTIPAGQTARIPISLEINKTNIEALNLKSILFSKETLGGLFYFDTRYIFDFQAQMGIKANLTLGPLVRHTQFDLNNSTLDQNGTNSSLRIPYSINTTGILSGRNVSISGNMSNDTQVLGTFDQNISIDKNVQSEFVINLTQGAAEHLATSSDHLTLNLTVTVANYSRDFQVERDWQPPSGGGGNG